MTREAIEHAVVTALRDTDPADIASVARTAVAVVLSFPFDVLHQASLPTNRVKGVERNQVISHTDGWRVK